MLENIGWYLTVLLLNRPRHDTGHTRTQLLHLHDGAHQCVAFAALEVRPQLQCARVQRPRARMPQQALTLRTMPVRVGVGVEVEDGVGSDGSRISGREE